MLTAAIDSYIALRRSVGFKFVDEGYMLASYGRFAAARGDAHVRSESVLEWAVLASTPARRETRLRIVVGFARHAQAEDARHQIPPRYAFGNNGRLRKPPYIYSLSEIQRLLDSAAKLGPCGSLRPRTYYTLFGLLACTGLRISEALALRLADFSGGVLVVRKTKFQKSRLVPLHDTAVVALDEYVQERQQGRFLDDHLFMSEQGRPLGYKHEVLPTFWQLAGKRSNRTDVCPRPTIHGLRHTFAVRSLESSPNGRDHLGWHIRALSTYLGHSSVAETYWYLSSTPHLMNDLADLCQPIVEGVAS
jgi:integrase/recombinase XerD